MNQWNNEWINEIANEPRGGVYTKIPNPGPGGGIHFFIFFMNFQIGIDTKCGGGCPTFETKKNWSCN